MTLTISEFTQLPTLFTIPKPIYFLLQRGFLKELSNNSGVSNWQTLANFEDKNINDKVTIKVHKALQANMTSVNFINQWISASVWFNDVPCMIIRNPDPSLSLPQDSYPKHFIINHTAHKAMLYYILSFMEEDRVIDKSIRNQGVWNRELLYGDRTLKQPQELIQPQVYDMELAVKAINL